MPLQRVSRKKEARYWRITFSGMVIAIQSGRDEILSVSTAV
jgi:hypothetical protein